MKLELSMKTKGVLTLIGGFFLLLMTGSIFLWGQLNVYVTSYFRQKEDQGLELSVGGAIFPVMMASLATGIPVGIKMLKFFGSARVSLLISCIVASLMVILSSFAQRFYQFVIIYGVINGIASGTIYFVPIYMGYLYFPNNKGLVAGVNTCGFALNSFLFGLLFFKLVNPDGLSQVSNSDGFSYFEGASVSVTTNVPTALRSIGYIFLLVSIVSSQMIMYHPNQIGEEEKRLKKQLDKKEQEKKELMEVQQNLINICSPNQLNGNNNYDFTTQQANPNHFNTDLEDNQEAGPIKYTFENTNQQNLIEKQIDIVQMEEEIIQQKIQITINKDQQTEYLYINPEILDQFKQNDGHPEFNEKNFCNSSVQQKKLIELMNQESNPIRQQHQNSFIDKKTKGDDNEKQFETLKGSLEVKEKEIELNLQELKKRNSVMVENLNKLGAPSVLACLKQPQLYMSIFLGFLAVGFGLLVNGNYKSMASDYGFKSDSFQSLVGSLGGIANGFCRPVWSTLLDKYPFKRILQIIIVVDIVTSLSMQSTHSNNGFFALWVFIVHLTLGGILGIWPVFSSQLNGVKVGAQLFGLYWYGFSISNLLQFFIVFELKKKIGFNNIFYIYFAQSLLALIIISFYKFKVNWSKYYHEIPNSIQQSQQTQMQTMLTIENQNNNNNTPKNFNIITPKNHNDNQNGQKISPQ